jgi:hypothetical protein
MSPEKIQGGGENADLLRFVACLLGIFILADSLTQLWQAASGLDLGNRSWRIANFRLLFTQVTPIAIGLLLVGQYLARKAGWRALGSLSFVFAALTIALASIYVVDFAALMRTLDGPPLGQLKRSSAQVLVSAFGFGLALLWVGVKSLRVRPA